MTRHYDSFVVRCWDLGDDHWRIEIEHMQSAGRTCTSSFAAAIGWIDAQCGKHVTAPMLEWSQSGVADEKVVSHEERTTEGKRAE